MMWHHRGRDVVPREVRPNARKHLYRAALREAHDVANRSIDRLRELQQRFPADLPDDLLSCLQQAHGDMPPGTADPVSERRWAPRFPKPRGKVFITDPHAAAMREARVVDWSWTGVRMLLPAPERQGAILLVHPAEPAATSPVRVEVRYCFPADGGWVAGCQALRSA